MESTYKENRIPQTTCKETFEYLGLLTTGAPDPLAMYIPYLQDAKTSVILPFLTLTLQRFSNDTRYWNDLRYLDLWMIYAENTGKPVKVYEEMLGNSIGKKAAIIYVAVADIYETARELVLAEYSYLLGLLRGAEPVLKLRKMHREFLRRTEALSTRKNEDVSLEENKALGYLRRQADCVQLLVESPVPDRSILFEEELRNSAAKHSPKMSELYCSPHPSSTTISSSPQLSQGRLPLRHININNR